jgi:hypothetical protein
VRQVWATRLVLLVGAFLVVAAVIFAVART